MPTAALSYAHTGTPSLQVSDARGMMVRSVQFRRREPRDPVDTQVTSQRFDAVGRLLGSRDPYLFELAKTDLLTPFNVTEVASLSGVVLLTDSVDAGWRVALAGGAGQMIERCDGRGSRSLTEYDQLLRPLAVRESGPDVAEHTLERFTYADAGTDAIAHNLCGQLMRHDDPAGTVHVSDLNMAGQLLKHTRRFFLQTESPDWPMPAADRDALLETDDGATTSYQFAATGEPLKQTDALDNLQIFAYTVAGQLKHARLTLAGEGQLEKLLVSDIDYNVMDQIQSETAGNGVITRRRYDEASSRLTELSAHKANGTPLQDLKYRYDAVGNVLSIEDAAQPIRYFNNQRVEPTRTYRYDTLYQLIEASGCEAKTGQSGPALPDYQSLSTDPGQIANYTQTYNYDAGRNLLELVHLGAQAHGRTLTRERYSNRCLPERDNRPLTEDQLANGFDANGNLLELQAGEPLGWDLRNQLRAVQLIVRKNAQADGECYIYDGGGQRVRKVNVSQTGTRTITREVRYLPGLEIRTHGKPGEILHVITVSAGTNSVQVLHCVAGRPDEVPQNQMRYNLNDHLGSSALELDETANLISQEWYYPFGGTAYWAGRNAIEASYKTVCYSGKERDVSGLYYYGFRYYAPWVQQWINPDPAGYVDGMNLFSMVGNGPITYIDPDGRVKNHPTQQEIDSYAEQLKDFSDMPEDAVNEVISKYLSKKNIDASVYLESIKAAAGMPTSAKTYHRKLTESERKGIHLFWSTNAGSRYINSITRNHLLGKVVQERLTLSEAERDARKELRSNLGDSSIKMTTEMNQKCFTPAMALLSAHQNDPRRTINLMKATFVERAPETAVYRGALVNPFITKGDIVKASGFTSFSPDEETASMFTSLGHNDEFKNGKSPVVLVADGGYKLLTSITEAEVVFLPTTQFEVTGVHRGRKNTMFFLKMVDNKAGQHKHII